MKSRIRTIILALILLLFNIGTASAFSETDNLTLLVNDTKESVPYQEFSAWAKVVPHLERSSLSAEIENINYCPINKISCRLWTGEKHRLNISKKELLTLHTERIKTYLTDLERRVNKDPVEAKFSVTQGKVSAFSLSQNGLALDKNASLQIISEKIKQPILPTEIKLAHKIIEPKIKSEDVENLGISTLIGEGKSNFRGSPKNRIYNIKVAIERFNGVLIKPGEEFSFVNVLGEVDEEHGYKAELVIKKNKTEPEFGGGICQVSSTAFRAAIWSGLKITARRNHAYPVAYYNPQGMDATVYVPRPDLRFINNTPGHILIQTIIEGTELLFRFYGTSDGRKIEVDGPKIIEKNPDGSMKTTFTQKVFDKDGKELIKDIFNSAYDSPDKYPHPGQEKFTTKPADWSKKQWSDYKKTNP